MMFPLLESPFQPSFQALWVGKFWKTVSSQKTEHVILS